MEKIQNRWIAGQITRIPLRFLCAIILVFLLAPLIVIVFTSFSYEPYPDFPPKGYSLRWYVEFFRSEEFIESLFLSIHVGVWTTFFALLIGIPVSLAMVRHRFRGSGLLNSICMSPILFPHVVIGIALLIFYSRVGMSNSFAGLVCAHVVMAVPFVTRLVSANLYGLDKQLEEASLNLGASHMKTVFKITLPLIKPGIIAGGIFAFFISFDEVTVTLFLAGPGITTLPIRLYTFVEYSSDPTIAAASAFMILLALCIGVPAGWRFLGIKK